MSEPIHPQFSTNSTVEVSSNELGFMGARFEATVIDPIHKYTPNSKSLAKRMCSKILVEYHTLLCDDDDSKPLREFVDFDSLRPCPPSSEDCVSYEKGDFVDAFYKDGWWTGVVNDVMQDSVYSVLFRNPSDQIHFSSSKIRLHLNWVDGSWVRPEKKSMEETIFCLGAAVEVTKNNCDSWFPAKIIGTNINSYVVEFQSFVNNDTTIGALQGSVNIQDIRPSPPGFEKKFLRLMDMVESFFDFCWQGGVVTKIHPSKRYTVSFKDANMYKELEHHELRPRMEWIDWKWVVGPVPLNMIPSGQKEYRTRKGRDTRTPSRPCKKLKEGSGAVQNPSLLQFDKNDQHNNVTNITTPSVRNRSSKTFILDHVPSHSESSLQGNNIVENEQQLSGQPGRVVEDSSTRRVKLQKFLLTVNQESELIADIDAIASVEKSTERERSTNNVMDEATDIKEPTEEKQIDEKELAVEGDIFVSPDKKSPYKEFSKRRSKIPAKWKSMVLIQKKSKSSTSVKKGRGRPSKPIKSPEASDKRSNGNVIAAANVAIKNSKTNGPKTNEQSSSPMKRRGRRLFEPTIESPKVPDKKNNGDVVGNRDIGNFKVKSGSKTGNQFSNSMMRGRGRACKPTTKSPQTSDKNYGDLVVITSSDANITNSKINGAKTDPKDFSTEKLAEYEAGSTVKSENGVNGADSALSYDNRPLAEWIDEVYNNSTMADESIVIQGNEKIKSKLVETPIIGNTTPEVEKVGNQSCFVRRSPIWREFETMKAFKKLPQNPHFIPLAKCREEFREGSAIGYMVSFGRLVERVSELTFEDPKSVFDSLLGSLCELEVFGFDVKPIQNRVNEIFSLKLEKDRLLERSREVKSNIVKVTQEIVKLKKEEDAIETMIKDLEDKRNVIRKKQASRDSDMNMLRAVSDIVDKDIEHLIQEYKKIENSAI